MRSSIEAQSCASVPPAPAWISMKQLFGSSGLLNIRRNSSSATCLRQLRSHRHRPQPSVASSSSLRAMANKLARVAHGCIRECAASARSLLALCFSLPSSCARFGSFQISGLRAPGRLPRAGVLSHRSQRYLRSSDRRAAHVREVPSIRLRRSASMMSFGTFFDEAPNYRAACSIISCKRRSPM